MTFQNIRLDKNSPVAVYTQLAGELARRIRELNPGSCEVELPSERTLGSALGLNRATVHKAYMELLEKGIVERKADKSLVLRSAARKKLEGGVRAIGVLLPALFSEYLALDTFPQIRLQYLEGIIDRATTLNYAIHMLLMPPPQAPDPEADEFIKTRLSGLTGVLHLGLRLCDDDPALERICAYTGVPQVSISCVADRFPNIGAVFSGFRQAAESLFHAMKRRRVRTCALVRYPYDASVRAPRRCFKYVAEERSDRMRAGLISAGFAVAEDFLFNEETPYSAFLEYLRRHPRPDVFLCHNDQAAEKILKWCGRAGIRVPEELKIVGFDGADEGSPLTTIRQPAVRIGSAAVDLLLEHFESGIRADNRFRVLEAEFVPGDTL